MTEALPKNLYTAAQVRAFDRIAIDEYNIPGIQLMKRAGVAAFDELLQRWPDLAHLHVFCGTGNNGGDGFIVAALAAQRNLPVTAWQVGDAAKIRGDALLARQFAVQAGVRIQSFAGAIPAEGVIVDALLGTGLGGEVKTPFAEAIDAINGSGLSVLAIDIPSGLCSDTGRVLGVAVKAIATITFIALKRGLFTADAADCCGAIEFASLQVPAEVYAREQPSCTRIGLSDFTADLAPRPRTAHKGSYGHVVVIGGDYGMAGAVAMASQAAARTGAGLVSCATRPEHIAALVARCPEVMAHGVNSLGELGPLLEYPDGRKRATAIVIGPGLGKSAWAEQMLFGVWRHLQTSPIPVLVDADALNLLAEGSIIPQPHYAKWVLTPHPGEAARLLGCTAAEIQRDRFAAATALQQRYGGVVVLKGAGSLIASRDGIVVGNYGNPGMATGGMGDVLSGIVGGLLAQGIAVERAAALAVCLHGCAADLVAQAGERGLLATDLLPHLRGLLNP